MDFASAEPVDVAAENGHAARIKRGGDVGVERRGRGRGVGTVEYRDQGNVPQRAANRVLRERPERANLEEPGTVAVLTQLVDDVLDGAAGGAEQDDRALRVVEAVRLDGRVTSAAQVRELRGDEFEDLERRFERDRLCVRGTA